MTCCDAMREEIRKWLNPPPIGLQPGPPLRFLWPRDDGVVRCSLCGAEWGPVRTKKPQTATKVNDDMTVAFMAGFHKRDDEVRALQAELRDCQERMGREVRAHEETRRRMVYAERCARQDLLRAFRAGFDVSREGFNGECPIAHCAPGDNEPITEGYKSAALADALDRLFNRWMPLPPGPES
jgi:hypothetical protein